MIRENLAGSRITLSSEKQGRLRVQATGALVLYDLSNICLPQTGHRKQSKETLLCVQIQLTGPVSLFGVHSQKHRRLQRQRITKKRWLSQREGRPRKAGPLGLPALLQLTGYPGFISHFGTLLPPPCRTASGKGGCAYVLKALGFARQFSPSLFSLAYSWPDSKPLTPESWERRVLGRSEARDGSNLCVSRCGRVYLAKPG